jgi:two-component system, OmpR family, sensor histidine kinase KdpD
MNPEASPVPQSRQMLVVRGVLLAAVLLTAAAALSAASARGRPFPALLVDAYGEYSTIQLPSWPEAPQRMGTYIPLVEVEHVKVDAAQTRTRASRALMELLERSFADRAEVRLSFSGRAVEELRPLLRVGHEELLLLFGLYALSAWLILWSGVTVFRLSGRPVAGGAYLFWSASAFSLLVTIFDYHTMNWLVPLFSVSTVALPISTLWLAYSFPAPPPWGARLVQRALVALTVAGALVAAWLIACYLRGEDPSIIRRGVILAILLGIVTLVLAVLLRLGRSSGQASAELITASWGLVLVPLIIATALAINTVTGKDFLHLLLPFILLTFPLSIGYAMIRNNILATQAILTPQMLMVPLGLCSVILALFSGYATAIFIGHYHEVAQGVLPILIGVLIFFGLMEWGRRMSARLFFSAALEFRPTIEDLSDQLASLQKVSEVRQAVEQVVLRWLPTGATQVLEPQALVTVAHLPTDYQERLEEGEQVWTLESHEQRHLLVPMRSLGELRGVLLVAAKQGAALYTKADLELLKTIASLGAVALHHAAVLQELERLQRQEREAAREDKRLALGVLSAELSHELGYPLNYIRYLLRQLSRGVPLASKDVEAGHEEVERIRSMIEDLRRFKLPAPRLEPTSVLAPIQRALELNRELLQEKHIQVSVEVPGELKVLAADSLVRVFANLLRNAAQAAGEQGQLGVRTFRKEQELALEVWDSGEGVPEPVRAQLFKHWVTTKEGGSGIGLAVTQRIVLGFGWQISYHREEGRTCFRLSLPLDHVVPPTTSQPEE